MDDFDPGLAARLRASADERITAKIAAAKTQADQRREIRATFSKRRQVGVERRNALRATRLRITNRHQQKGDRP